MDTDTWQRIDLNDALSNMNLEETDACANVLKGSQHTSLKIMPNHHIDPDGDLRGFMFTCNLNDKAEVLPINKRMCDMTSLYECGLSAESDQIFHPDALRIINDCDTYVEKMKHYIQGLKSCSHEPAGFDCINDQGTDSRYHQYASDQRVWAESEPAKVGIYHAFTRSHTKDRREHKLYIVVSGWLRHACEEFQNLWHDCRSHQTCQAIILSEEMTWLRRATFRNHNRIASDIADVCGLSVRRVIDMEDPTGKRRMVLPTTYTYKVDCDISKRLHQARVVDGGCFLDTDTNGVLFEMFASEGFWLFQGPKDLSDCNAYGSQFDYIKRTPCFPTQTVRYHSRFPVQDPRSSVRVMNTSITDSVIKTKVGVHQDFIFPDEHFIKRLANMGFNRNDGILNLMPIVCYVSNDGE